MINTIKTAIAQNLNKSFGDKYNIYTEVVEQDFKVPCFFINNTEFIADKEIKGFKITYSFDIAFIPKEDEKEKFNVNYITPKLMCSLDFIEINNKLYKASNVKMSVQNNVLIVSTDYSYHTNNNDTKAKMQNLIQHRGRKNG